MTIKSLIANGWFLSNPDIGAPDGHYLYDFSVSEGLNYALLKCIALFSSDWAVVGNLFFLLTFPLCAVSALFVLRQFGLRGPFAIAGSLLFSLLPYHFMRGSGHLFLSCYYMVPFIVWLAVLIYQDRLAMGSKRHVWGYAAICALCGSSGIYYAFFGSFFLLLSGCASSLSSRKLRPLGAASLFVLLISLTIAINILPNVVYRIVNGPNKEVAVRSIGEAELYGLKIAQLLLPVDNDRVHYLSFLKEKYNSHNAFINENTSASLGLLGSLGLLFLVFRLMVFKRNKEQWSGTDSLLDAFSIYAVSGILLATIGGFSSLFSLFITPAIRGYNRISVFIAFFAIAAFFFVVQRWTAKMNSKVVFSLGAALLALGIYNQTSPSFSLREGAKRFRRNFKEDQAFFRRMDTMLPKGSMVFQLPYHAFPESAPKHFMRDYAHFKAALHSQSLKWSYGAIKGRETDLWQRKVSALPLPEFIQQIASRGYRGLYLDRDAYPDRGRSIEEQLNQLLNSPPVSKHNKCFWDLGPYAGALP